MMHQMIRDMGREIIRQESPDLGRRSRLWHRDAFDVIREKIVSDFILFYLFLVCMFLILSYYYFLKKFPFLNKSFYRVPKELSASPLTYKGC